MFDIILLKTVGFTFPEKLVYFLAKVTFSTFAALYELRQEI